MIARNAYHLLPIIILIKFWQNLSTFCLSSYFAKLNPILLRSIHSLFPRLLSSWSGIYDHIIDIVATFTLLCPYVSQITSQGSLLVPFIFDILPLPYCFHMCHHFNINRFTSLPCWFWYLGLGLFHIFISSYLMSHVSLVNHSCVQSIVRLISVIMTLESCLDLISHESNQQFHESYQLFTIACIKKVQMIGDSNDSVKYSCKPRPCSPFAVPQLRKYLQRSVFMIGVI